jgi:hypothetical protein
MQMEGIGGTGGMIAVGSPGVGAWLCWDDSAGVGVEEVSRRRDRDLERRRSLEPITDPLRLRNKGILIMSNPITGIHAHLSFDD